jgi:hypothetical protein
VVEDSYTSQSDFGAVHGSVNYLGVNAPPGERRAYVKFSVSGVPSDATQVTAMLQLWARKSGSATLTMWSVPSTWSESTLTWANQPALGVAVTSRTGVTSGQYNGFDVSSYVSGNGTYALAITSSSSTELSFVSKEATSNHPALLTLNWTPSTSTSSTTTTTSASTTSTTSTTTPPSAADPIVASAGDIACTPGATVSKYACQQAAVSDLVTGSDVTAVQTLGDNQYDSGTLSEFIGSYDLSWGRVKDKTYPAPGNHEYLTTGGSGYFSYFGASAGDPSKGYYSYDIGAWHVIVLNDEISHSIGSAQEQWLKSDLANNAALCTLAVWHKPRFSSASSTASVSGVAPFWQDLYNGKADVVLNGHMHNYERFAPQNPNGVADSVNGIREFIVGTGGRSHQSFAGPILATSEVRDATSFGVLELTLHSSSYDWKFVPAAGSAFTDSGSDACH